MPGESHRVEFEVNVTELSDRIAEIESDLGASPGRTDVLVVAETSAETTLAGEAIDETRSDRLEIEPGGSTYGVAADLSGESVERVTETVAVPVDTDPLRRYGGAALAGLGFLCAVGVLALGRTGRFEVPPGVRAEIRHERERDRFDEWISTANIPQPTDEEREIAVGSLEDLVDIGIDSDRRVLEGATTGRYAVLDGDTRYVFEPALSAPDASPEANESENATGSSDKPENEAEPSDTASGTDSPDEADFEDTDVERGEADE